MKKTTETIAIVDDDNSVRESLQLLLRAADFEVLTFASAEKFLASFAGKKIDCLIVDVNLPGITGVALVRLMVADGNATPVVLITARDDTATLELIRSVGPVPLLRKPFSEEDLFREIAGALSR
jgi:FixJ family two-component response regulator